METEVDLNQGSTEIDVFTTQSYQKLMMAENSSFVPPAFPVNFEHVHSPVGSRLKFFFSNWELVSQNSFILNTIKYGYRIKFDENPPLTVNPRPFELSLPPDQQKILDEELQIFLDNNVIRPADVTTPGFYSPVFLREKPRHNLNDPIKYRVIIDLSFLNTFIHKVHFKMESSNTIRATLQVGDYFFTLDLTSAYNTVPMHEKSVKYLRFWWNNQAFEFTALCFGLSTAPWLFSSIMAEMAKYLHRSSVGSLFYLDDLLFRDLILQRITSNQPLILYFVQSLGWIINWDKSQLPIMQRGVYVGTDFDLLAGMVFPPPDRWIKLQRKLDPFFHISMASAHQWSSLMGTITSCQDLTDLGRLMARELQIHLNLHWKDRNNIHVQIPVTPNIQKALRWWTYPENVMSGTPLRPPPHTVELWSDASTTGFGGYIQEGNTHRGDFAGSWSPSQAKNHINYLELLSVDILLKHFEHIVTNQSVLCHIDNISALTYINKKGGSRSPTLQSLCSQLLLWCHQRNIVLRAVHIKGTLNVQADYLSRKSHKTPVNTEWSIHPSIIIRIKNTWPDHPNLDLFATSLNHKFPSYVSPVPDPNAFAQDALSLDWTGFVAYAYPPPSIIMHVLNKIALHPCVIYLVAPNWPRMHWFPKLLDLLIDIPRKIPCLPKLLRQPTTHIFHPNVNSMDLHVFKLSRDVSKQKAFLTMLQNPSVRKTDSHLKTVMNDTGKNMYLGVKNGLMIPSWHL